MSDLAALVKQAHDLGARFRIDGDRVEISAQSPLPGTLMKQLRECKAEVLAYLKSGAALFDLPFPTGFGGLPKTQVETAELVNDRFEITDPVHRRYNVIAWVRGYYQDRGENHGELYEVIKLEQQRLGQILDQNYRGG